MNRLRKKTIVRNNNHPVKRPGSSVPELKERIITLSRQLFGMYGIKSITVSTITRQLSVSKKTFYTCFSSKSALVEELVEQVISQNRSELIVAAAQAQDPIEEIVMQWATLSNFLQALHGAFFWQVSKYYPAAYAMVKVFQQEFLYRYVYSNIEKGIATGLYRTGIRPTVIAGLLTSGIWFPSNEKQDAPDQSINQEREVQLLRYHLHAIASEKGLLLVTRYADECRSAKR